MRRLGTSEQKAARYAADDKAWAKSYPALYAFLTDGEYDEQDGGGKRELGLLTVWATGGAFHAKLRDNDSGHVCYVTGTTVVDLLCAADAACSDPAGGWKPEAVSGKKSRK